MSPQQQEAAGNAGAIGSGLLWIIGFISVQDVAFIASIAVSLMTGFIALPKFRETFKKEKDRFFRRRKKGEQS